MLVLELGSAHLFVPNLLPRKGAWMIAGGLNMLGVDL